MFILAQILRTIIYKQITCPMFKWSLPITLSWMILIFIFSNCGGDKNKLSEEEIEWEANQRFKTLPDSLIQTIMKECVDNQQQLVEEKVDSLIIEHLKKTETTTSEF
jgi:hypothetical protein